jgi:DNA modification methylase
MKLRISQTDLRKRTKSSLPKEPGLGYSTERGQMLVGGTEQVLASRAAEKLRGKVQMIFTSPPFPLNRKKKYGNLNGDDYVDWLAGFAPRFSELLKPDGSIVLELGNAWEPGRPVMSTLALKALLAFLEKGRFFLCQQFICYNPARLPSPAQWVNVDRVRVKDSYTHVWWMAPSEHPLANNRQVLRDYSASMQRLLATKHYNPGKRPSGHNIGKKSFLRNNNGAIPPNVLMLTNTKSSDAYQTYCREKRLPIHPARMPSGLPEFFVKFLTVPGNLVLDPFAGSNTTGAVAERLKRRWIAIEPDAKYAAGSKGRFLGWTRIRS